MSKNHPHDNIYSILGKLSDLDAKHAPKAEAKNTAPSVIYDTVPARGSLMEGVDSLQARLKREFVSEKTVNKYAVGMAAAKKQAGITKTPAHNLPKKVVKKGHEIAKAIDEAEEACNECGLPMEGCGCNHVDEERETLKTKTGTIYKGGTYGNAAYDDEPSSATGTKAINPDGTTKRGRPRVRDPIVRKNAPGVKGRPKKVASTGPTLSANDPFGRIAPTAHKAKSVPGRKVKGSASMESMSIAESLKGVERRIMEGLSFKKMAEQRHQSIEEMMGQMSADMEHFKESGECSDFLRDCMEIRGQYKMLETVPTAPMAFQPGTVVYHRGQAGRVDRVDGQKVFVHTSGGNMDVWPASDVSSQKQSMLSTIKKDAGDIATGLKGFFTGGPEHTMEDQELNELARLAGLTTETQKSPMADKDYDRDGRIETQKDEVHGSHRRAAGLDEGSEVDFDKVLEAIAAMYGDDIWENDAMQDLADDLMQAGPTDQELDQIIATGELPPRLADTEFTNSDDVQHGGRDQATGELDEIRQLAGLADEGNEFTGKLKSTPKGGNFEIGGHEYTDTSNLDEVEEVDEPAQDLENAPDEEYFSMKASTLNPGEGDNGEKKMFGGRGDNPMSQQPSRPAKPVMNVTALEAKLSAEYDSIKKQK